MPPKIRPPKGFQENLSAGDLLIANPTAMARIPAYGISEEMLGKALAIIPRKLRNVIKKRLGVVRGTKVLAAGEGRYVDPAVQEIPDLARAAKSEVWIGTGAKPSGGPHIKQVPVPGKVYPESVFTKEYPGYPLDIKDKLEAITHELQHALVEIAPAERVRGISRLGKAALPGVPEDAAANIGALSLRRGSPDVVSEFEPIISEALAGRPYGLETGSQAARELSPAFIKMMRERAKRIR